MFGKLKQLTELIEDRKTYRYFRDYFFRLSGVNYFQQRVIYDFFKEKLMDIEGRRDLSEVDLIRSDLLKYYSAGLKEHLDEYDQKMKKSLSELEKMEI